MITQVKRGKKPKHRVTGGTRGMPLFPTSRRQSTKHGAQDDRRATGAQQAECLAALGLHVSQVAHEGRNALQLVTMHREMLAEALDNPDAIREHLEGLRAAESRLAALFGNVRDFAAPIQARKRSMDLRQVWRGEFQKLVGVHRKRKIMLVDEGCDEVLIEADPDSLGQLFYNLFANAIAAAQDDVCIRIECVRRWQQGSSAWQLTITDNGPGFTSEQLQLAGRPFFTTKRSGTGLGLAVCRRIVEAHGGTIELANSAGAGAAIRLVIPQSPESHRFVNP